MGRKVGVWRRVKSDQMRGEGRCRSKGAEKAGTWGGGIRCFRKAESVGRGVKGAKVG